MRGGSPTEWRDCRRDEETGAQRRFPTRAAFIARLRAANRPTTRDLRTARAMKKRPALALDPGFGG